jgi:hypothetical protein
MELTEIEKQAPSERLAKNLEYFKGRAEDAAALDECQTACIGSSTHHGAFCIEMALVHLGIGLDNNISVRSAKGYLEAALSEMKDAKFILDGYHAWHKQNKEWEEEASEDLDICGYAGKWKSAKEGVTRDQPKLSGSAYWDAVRTYYLELGGCYLSERTESAPIDWNAPLPHPIVPVVGDWSEPIKVRRA